MKPGIWSSVIRASAAEPARQWLCRACLARTSSRSISSTPSRQADPVALTEDGPQKKEPLRIRDPEEFRRRKQAKARYAKMLDLKLPHPIPVQYLAHVDPRALRPEEAHQRKHLFRWGMAGHVDGDFNPKPETNREIKGVVVSAGKMDRTVKVRVPGQRYNKQVKKYFSVYTNHLVHDPNNSLLEGDVVTLHRLTVSKTVRHVIASIVAPFGKAVHERPPVLTPEERLQQYKEKRIARLDLKMLRVQAAAGSKISQSELSKRRQVPGQKVTEAAFLQAEAYAKWWAKRHDGKVPRLRRPLISKSEPARKHSDPKKNPAVVNVAKAAQLNEVAEKNIEEAVAKEAQLEKKGLQAEATA